MKNITSFKEFQLIKEDKEFTNNTKWGDSLVGKALGGLWKLGGKLVKTLLRKNLSGLAVKIDREHLKGVILWCYENDINLETGESFKYKKGTEGQSTPETGEQDSGTVPESKESDISDEYTEKFKTATPKMKTKAGVDAIKKFYVDLSAIKTKEDLKKKLTTPQKNYIPVQIVLGSKYNKLLSAIKNDTFKFVNDKNNATDEEDKKAYDHDIKRLGDYTTCYIIAKKEVGELMKKYGLKEKTEPDNTSTDNTNKPADNTNKPADNTNKPADDEKTYTNKQQDEQNPNPSADGNDEKPESENEGENVETPEEETPKVKSAANLLASRKAKNRNKGRIDSANSSFEFDFEDDALVYDLFEDFDDLLEENEILDESELTMEALTVRKLFQRRNFSAWVQRNFTKFNDPNQLHKKSLRDKLPEEIQMTEVRKVNIIKIAEAMIRVDKANAETPETQTDKTESQSTEISKKAPSKEVATYLVDVNAIYDNQLSAELIYTDEDSRIIKSEEIAWKKKIMGIRSKYKDVLLVDKLDPTSTNFILSSAEKSKTVQKKMAGGAEPVQKAIWVEESVKKFGLTYKNDKNESFGKVDLKDGDTYMIRIDWDYPSKTRPRNSTTLAVEYKKVDGEISGFVVMQSYKDEFVKTFDIGKGGDTKNSEDLDFLKFVRGKSTTGTPCILFETKNFYLPTNNSYLEADAFMFLITDKVLVPQLPTKTGDFKSPITIKQEIDKGKLDDSMRLPHMNIYKTYKIDDDKVKTLVQPKNITDSELAVKNLSKDAKEVNKLIISYTKPKK